MEDDPTKVCVFCCHLSSHSADLEAKGEKALWKRGKRSDRLACTGKGDVRGSARVAGRVPDLCIMYPVSFRPGRRVTHIPFHPLVSCLATFLCHFDTVTDKGGSTAAMHADQSGNEISVSPPCLTDFHRSTPLIPHPIRTFTLGLQVRLRARKY
jgi:hypothetical protein